MMNRKGEFAKEALVVLVAVVLTSGLIFFFLQSGIIDPSGSATNDDFINSDFVPYTRGGDLQIRNFRFCDAENAATGCLFERNSFTLGSEVHFFFEVYSSVFNGDLVVSENYRLIDPEGTVLLEIEEGEDFFFEEKSQASSDLIYFSDSFYLGVREKPGIYTLELYVTNPLNDKQAVLTKTFTAVEN